MTRWVVQTQHRGADHSVKHIEYKREVADVAADIGLYISMGWIVQQNDSISVTMRSPTQADGTYGYRHYWQEGW